MTIKLWDNKLWSRFRILRYASSKKRVAILAQQHNGTVVSEGLYKLIVGDERFYFVQCTECFRIEVAFDHTLVCACANKGTQKKAVVVPKTTTHRQGTVWVPKTVPVEPLDFLAVKITAARMGITEECAGCIGGKPAFYEIKYVDTAKQMHSLYLCGACVGYTDKVLALLANGERVDRRIATATEKKYNIPSLCSARVAGQLPGSRGQVCKKPIVRILGIQSLFTDGTIGAVVPVGRCDDHWQSLLAEASKPDARYTVSFNKKYEDFD